MALNVNTYHNDLLDMILKVNESIEETDGMSMIPKVILETDGDVFCITFLGEQLWDSDNNGKDDIEEVEKYIKKEMKECLENLSKIDIKLQEKCERVANAGLDEKENISKYLDILIPELETLLLLDLIPEQIKSITDLLWEVKNRISTTNWHLVAQGLRSYKAIYTKLEKDNLLKDYELHEYEVIIEAIEELGI